MITNFSKIIVSTLILFFIIVLINGVFFSINDIFDLLDYKKELVSYLELKKSFHFIKNYSVFNIIIIIVMIYLLIKFKNRIRHIFYFDNIQKKHFISILLFIAIISLIKFYLSNINLHADAGRYFKAGILIAESFENLDYNSIYHQRALFYTYPIFLIFPKTIISVQIVNLFMHLISCSLLAHIIYKEFGKHISFYFLVFYSLIFEFYMGISVVSHNIASIFYLSILCYLLYIVFKDNNKIFKSIIAIAIGFIIVINDFQRTIGIPILLSLLLILGLYVSKGKKINIKIIVLIFISFFCFSFFAHKFLSRSPVNKLEVMLYSFNDLNNSGTWRSGDENILNYLPLLDKEQKRKLTYEKFFSQIYNHPFKVLYLFKNKSKTFTKTKFHYSANGGYFRYFRGAGSQSFTEVVFSVGIIFLTVIIYIFSIIGLTFLFFKREKYNKIYILFPLILTLMLFFSEVNVPYKVLVFPSLCFFSAVGLSKYLNGGNLNFMENKNKLWSSLGFGLASILVTMFIARIYLSITPTNIIDFDKNKYSYDGMIIVNERYKPPNPYKLSFKTQKNVISELTINNDSEINNISFFIKTKIEPSKFKLDINGESIIPLAYQENQQNDRYFDFYYYYFNKTFKFITEEDIKIDFNKSNSEVIIKDILLN